MISKSWIIQIYVISEKTNWKKKKKWIFDKTCQFNIINLPKVEEENTKDNIPLILDNIRIEIISSNPNNNNIIHAFNEDDLKKEDNINIKIINNKKKNLFEINNSFICIKN